jgi:hypothetical protein
MKDASRNIVAIQHPNRSWTRALEVPRLKCRCGGYAESE